MNITEFAEAAGVSKSAVSRYFNHGYLSEKKREQIERTIKETGYVPSVQARNVRTKVTKMVGVIIPKLSGESFSRVVEGISDVLNEQGYQLLLVNTANDPQKEIEYLDFFSQNKVDGVIFLTGAFTPTHENRLKKMRIPVVIVGQEHRGFNCVCHDDERAAYALTSLMLKKGRKRPAFIGVIQEDSAVGLAREEGFLRAVRESGIEITVERKRTAGFTMESGYEQAASLFCAEETPDCIVCATDTIAAGVLLYCRESGICVPEQVMLAGIGDAQICRIAAVPLTSAHLHYRTSGSEAAQMLLNELKHSTEIPRVTKLDYEIVERKSTATEEYETI